MTSKKFNELSGILEELFPGLTFFPSGSVSNPHFVFKEYEICRLIRTKEIDLHEKETLALEMIKSKAFACLFPHDPLQTWEELETNIQNGGCNVIRYFISKIDKLFMDGFNKVVQKEQKLNESPVTDHFICKVFGEKSISINQLNEPKGLNICDHSPATLYKAFEWHAHKQYTLIRLGREFPIEDLHEKWKSELQNKINDKNENNNYLALNNFYNGFISIYDDTYNVLKKNGVDINADIRFALDIINALFVEKLQDPKTPAINKINASSNPAWLSFASKIEKMISITLERKPEGYDSIHVPTDFITLTGQISGQLGHEYGKVLSQGVKNEVNWKKYESSSDFDFDYFSESDMKNINNYWKTLMNNLQENDKILTEGNKNTFEKIKILYAKLQEPFFKTIFSEKSIEIINGLYIKISSEVSLDVELDEDEKNSICPEDRHKTTLIEDAEVFANKFLIKEFNADNEKDFIISMTKNGEWSISGNEVDIHYMESGSLIITRYKGEPIDPELSVLFLHKVDKALKNYWKWKKMNKKEGGGNDV